ncbi:MAG: type II toxin-antitoxin system HicA family toxin [Bryobacteraceae bacterium]
MNGKQAVRALENLGFRLDRVEGSHHMMVKGKHPRTIPIPVHGSKPLPKGTLASIIRTAGVTRQQFLRSLR